MFNTNSWVSLRDNIWLELEGVNRVIQMRRYLKAATEKIWGQTKLKNAGRNKSNVATLRVKKTFVINPQMRHSKKRIYSLLEQRNILIFKSFLELNLTFSNDFHDKQSCTGHLL